MRIAIISYMIGSFLVCQTIPSQYGMVDPRKLENQESDASLNMQIVSSSIPLEKTIDPATYILGPGDVIGIDIISTVHMFFTLNVNPTGDLLIPSAGVLNVAGKTLYDAIINIKALIREQYKNSKVHVSLLEVRSFLVPFTGAVYNPGHFQVYATQRLWTILKDAKGLHPYANNETVEISHINGEKSVISLHQYLMDGDNKNNPVLSEGDQVHIPFKEEISSILINQVHATEEIVWITGFVLYPGSYKYIPGYTSDEYIGLAGGALNRGSEKSTFVLHQGKNVKGSIIQPGDNIVVPESFKSKIIGGASIMQTITAFASLYLTYIAATK